MNILYLTYGTTIGSTGRILQHWLQIGARERLRGALVVRPGSEYAEWGLRNGVPTLVDPMPWPNRRAPWSVLWHAARVARCPRRAGIQIIHCNEHDVYPFAHVVNRFLRLPIVCHVRYRLPRGFAEWAFGGPRCPDALMWTSHQQRADSVDAVVGIVPEERQQVLRLGVDVNDVARHALHGRALRREWGIADDELLIGMPSPLRPRKRVEDFVAMIERLAPTRPDVVGVIAGQEVAGDEQYRVRIERLIAQSGLGRRLRWVGYLSPIEPFHHACDVSVSTSEYETFGNSVCEAMACGKPVVAYRVGSMAEVMGDAGVLVAARDVEGLTNSVVALANDAKLRSTVISDRARRRVQKEFNPADSYQQMEDVYRNLARPLYLETLQTEQRT